MQEAVAPDYGAMAAIMGADDDAVLDACREAAQGEVVEPVNFNAPGQVVIAGHRAAVERAMVAAKARGAKRAVLLPVSAPFPQLAAEGRPRRSSPRGSPRWRLHARRSRCCTTSTWHRTPTCAIREALATAGGEPGALDETIGALAARGVTHSSSAGRARCSPVLTRRIERLMAIALADDAAIAEARDTLAAA